MNQKLAWSDLSTDAQNILEWLEDIHVERNNLIVLEVGELPEVHGVSRNLIKRRVDAALLAEVVAFVVNRESDFETCEMTDTGIRLKLVDDQATLDASAAEDNAPGI